MSGRKILDATTHCEAEIRSRRRDRPRLVVTAWVEAWRHLTQLKTIGERREDATDNSAETGVHTGFPDDQDAYSTARHLPTSDLK